MNVIDIFIDPVSSSISIFSPIYYRPVHKNGDGETRKCKHFLNKSDADTSTRGHIDGRKITVNVAVLISACVPLTNPENFYILIMRARHCHFGCSRSAVHSLFYIYLWQYEAR